MIQEYVLGLALDKSKSSIRLVQKPKNSFEFGKLNGIGGLVIENEDQLGAMIREFYEQTGLISYPQDWYLYGMMLGDAFQIYLFVRFNDDILNLPGLTEETTLYDIADIKHPVISNLNWLLPLILDTDLSRMFISIKYNREK